MKSLITLTLLIGFIPMAHAEEDSGAPISFAVLKRATIGSYVLYMTSNKNQPNVDPIDVSYTVVQKTASEVTLEMFTRTPRGPFVLQTVYALQGSEAGKPLRARIKLGLNPPQDSPATGPRLASGLAHATVVEKENLPTEEAGRIDTTHYKRNNSDGTVTHMWMSDKVLPTGMVKTTDDSGNITMLVKYGTGSRSVMK